ncbi:NAD-dependent epimerase/dehydratase family protein [Chitinibacter bivalviorum]|uniref:NAD-dependent epimerase/dehydratase family protein n=1 Tax=Chitinibacter bivalviorum TaxID=2739434 RepID=UPI001FE34C1C|nr:NAD-dependent epimerase/dehydratase family protein [Chitinibacter bivalviorum]
MRKKRLLIIGCGDVVQRALPWLTQRFTVYATVRSAEKAIQLLTLGVHPIIADLDQRGSLKRIAGIADYLIHSAPPGEGQGDARTKKLLAAISRPRGAQQHRAILSQPPRRAVYISTSGIYGDHQGVWIDETSPQCATTARALRRISAERQLRHWSISQSLQASATQISIVRAPGIYALDRLPTARIERGDPGLIVTEDSVSNHIHADDLARAVCLALFRGLPQRAYNIVDDEPHAMSTWFDQVADFTGLPRVGRISRAQAQQQLSPVMLSYLNESRQIANQRAKRELRWRLRYPTTDVFFLQNKGMYIATTKY